MKKYYSFVGFDRSKARAKKTVNHVENFEIAGMDKVNCFKEIFPEYLCNLCAILFKVHFLLILNIFTRFFLCISQHINFRLIFINLLV